MKYFWASAIALLLGVSAAFAAPLHDAVRSGNLDQVKQALDGGAGIAEPDDAGDPPLVIAALAGNPEIVTLLLERGADVVAFLLANGADIEAKERNGYTPLSQAGWRGYWDAAGLLMKAGAVCQGPEVVGERFYEECLKRR
jgi:ankyrin repeat protein